MSRHRLTLGAALLAAAVATSSCTGFLRQISSDNNVDWEDTEQHFRFDTRDLTLELPGRWAQDDGEQVPFTHSHEYDVARVSADGVHLRLRAEVRSGNPDKCAVELGKVLPAQGWQLPNRYREVTIAGRPGSLLTADRQDTTLYAYCFRSNQAAMVYLLVSGASEVITPESADALLESSLTWKK